uniref:DUF3194 domain-containing protein n=1 Tax=Thermosphaera aggregans TaxID=54254 RepID=A0A7C2BKU5_9CREN
MGKPRELNLKISKITPEVMEELASLAEEKISSFLNENLPFKGDFSIIVSVEKVNDSLNIVLDVGVRGGFKDMVDYNEYIEKAIQYARKFLEEKLKEYSSEESADRTA